jgi:hypothetical protein
MTNHEAVQLIQSVIDTTSVAGSIAGIYACEDIIDMDVEGWVDEPISELLEQFSRHLEDVSHSFLNVIDCDEDVTEELVLFSSKTKTLFKSMTAYCSAREQIKEKIRLER